MSATQQFPKGPARFAAASASLAALLSLSVPVAWAQDPTGHAGHAGHDGMEMSMSTPGQAQSDTARQTTLLKDKKESEFNHHLAGFFVILAGLFLLVEGTLRQRWPPVRFAWPACFLVCGLFLLIFSDTELWPFGPQSWWYGLTQNLEDLQHKTFAAILLTLGALEIQRARDVLKSAWAGWAFPLLGLFGSVLLLFHEHHTGMHGAEHVNVMARIQTEHLHFAIAGCGIGVVKGLSELRTRWQTVFVKSWPLLLIVLGVLLLRYVE